MTVPEMELQTINCAVDEALSETVLQAEKHYSAEIDRLAGDVAHSPQTRVILLAGPSSAGKTTTANILRDRLNAGGRCAEVVSLDHFYRNREEDYPVNPDGSLDFENITALQTELIEKSLRDIIARRDCWLPRYDFKTATRTDRATFLPAREDSVVIVEGLHALNPIISGNLPQESLRKVFVSVSTNILRDGRRILSGRKIRFLRRMTRDHLYRGASPERTLSLWPKVLEGEDRYLYPYKELADDRIDTFHMYEVGLLRSFAEKMLMEAPPPTSIFLSLVMNAVRQFSPVSPEFVPQTSLIREFIPGGVYEHLY